MSGGWGDACGVFRPGMLRVGVCRLRRLGANSVQVGIYRTYIGYNTITTDVYYIINMYIYTHTPQCSFYTERNFAIRWISRGGRGRVQALLVLRNEN